jgi:hypothetical protein
VLDKFVLTLASLCLVTTLSVGAVWVQGGFEPGESPHPTAQQGIAEAPPGPSGFGNATPVPPPATASATPSPVAPAATRRTTTKRAARTAPRVAAVVPRTAAGAPILGTATAAVTGSTPTSSGSTTPPTSATETGAASGSGTSFQVASFNLLGSSHTKGSGRYAPGPSRMDGALQVLAQHDVSVVGFQEFQPDQRQAFTARATGWTMWPGLTMGRRAGENSVAWRDDTWTLSDKGLIDVPYFGGRIRPMPWVLLKNVATGKQVYVSTFHNPADVHGPAQRWREEATRREVVLWNRLEATGIPQVVTGDMNERTSFFCRVTAATPLHSADGGGTGAPCRPPAKPWIDWVLASPSVQLDDYVRDRSDLVRRTTDHPVVVARATLS